MHCDDEISIEKDSEIVTVSLGSTRHINFRSKVGPIVNITHELKHGTAYCMTRDSQNFWEHGIPLTPSVTAPRVSLTFRKLIPPSNPPPRVHPIQKPTRSRPSTAASQPPAERVLLLTDSIHNSLPVELFPDNIHCVKKDLFQLCDIDQHEYLFPHHKYVIVSSGINDLSRYNHDACSLLRNIFDKILHFCRKYPETTFIFNSLLSTKFSWLTPESTKVNRAMFDMSMRITNLWFFDSHHICMMIKQRGRIVLDPDGNGIHLTFLARREISHCLIRCIGELNRRSTTIQRFWPLRREYFSLLRNSWIN